MMGMTRLATPRELEIRNENRYRLHPQGKKRCTKCEVVYDNIVENFDIHHRNKDGHSVYTGQCKVCLTEIRANRISLYKTDIALYVKRLVPQVRCRAKEDNLNFNLSQEYLVGMWQQQQGMCYYTGHIMDLQSATESGKSPHIDFPSIDKIVPELGYVEGNVVWCLWGVNRMKNNLTKSQFIDFCKLITERFA